MLIQTWKKSKKKQNYYKSLLNGGKSILEMCIYIVETHKKRMVRMKRAVHYREGYKIAITDKFYELSDGKTVLYFGELRHRPTIQEVWNKTIGSYRSQEAITNAKRIKTNY